MITGQENLQDQQAWVNMWALVAVLGGAFVVAVLVGALVVPAVPVAPVVSVVPSAEAVLVEGSMVEVQ